MNKTILGIQIGDRFENVQQVQKTLTDFGCIIKTRLGLHQQSEFNEKCTEKGLIILELVENSKEKCLELEKTLDGIENVQVRKIEF